MHRDYLMGVPPKASRSGARPSRALLGLLAIATLLFVVAGAYLLGRRTAPAPSPSPMGQSEVPAQKYIATVPAPTVRAVPAKPAVPSLDAALVFRRPDKCEMAPATERLFTRMVKINPTTWEGSKGAAVRVPGFQRPIEPNFERRVEERPGVYVRDNVASLAVEGTWHGLRVIKLRYRFMEQSDFVELQVRFLESPAQVRATLNRYGFQIPAVGSWKETGGVVTTGMGVEPVPGGAALTCGTSMYY